MKKLITTILLALSLCPCLADNSIQRKMQNEFWNKPGVGENFRSIALVTAIWEDYKVGANDRQAQAYYNDVLTVKNKYCAFSDVKSVTNCKYATRTLDNMATIGKINIFSGSDNFYKAVNTLKTLKITIDDKEINYLDKELANIILGMF